MTIRTIFYFIFLKDLFIYLGGRGRGRGGEREREREGEREANSLLIALPHKGLDLMTLEIMT